MVPGNEWEVVNEFPETQADTVTLKICHDIDEPSKKIKEIVLSGEDITKIKSRRLGPPVAKFPSSLL